jgi:tetratricopeptide (TPR) repeat protein
VYDDGLAVDRHWNAGIVGKALAMNELGDPDAALALLDQALKQDPRSAVGHYYRGLILRDRGHLRDAAIAFERAIALDPDHLEAAIALSNVKDQLGDPDGALAVVEAARQYLPDDARLGAQVGALHLKLGHMRKAVAELSRAAAKLEDPVVIGNYGTAQAAVGDIDGAARTFERVVQLDPKSHEAIATLGQIYMKQGRLNDAEKLLDHAIRLKPGDARIRFTLGVLYDMTGRLDLAEKQYRAAIGIDDSVGVFYYQLGKVYGRQGKEEEAVDLLEKGRELDPSLPAPGM